MARVIVCLMCAVMSIMVGVACLKQASASLHRANSALECATHGGQMKGDVCSTRE